MNELSWPERSTSSRRANLQIFGNCKDVCSFWRAPYWILTPSMRSKSRIGVRIGSCQHHSHEVCRVRLKREKKLASCRQEMVSPLSTNPNTNTDTVHLDCSGNITTSCAADLEGSISMWGKSSFHFLNAFIIDQDLTMSQWNSNQKSPLSRCLTCRWGQSRPSTCLCTGELLTEKMISPPGQHTAKEATTTER